MKKNLLLFAIIPAFAFFQSCGSKTQEASVDSVATAETVDTNNEEAVVAKRVQLEKESAEKEEQRKLALVDKAKTNPTYTDNSGKTVYYKAEVDPTYIGGTNEMRKYLRDNLKYPTEARDNGLEGTVFVDFIVDEKGRVRDVVAADVVGDAVDLSFKEESVRVVAAMPAWTAGLQHGKAVDASYSIPITFRIGN